METLWNRWLPIIQDLNSYGGYFPSIFIIDSVCREIDERAKSGDSVCLAIRNKQIAFIGAIKGLQDYENLSASFEAYTEGVFYLVAKSRGVDLIDIKAGSKQGSTPDFATVSSPEIRFEVKTINFATPSQSYSRAAEDGLNAQLEASEDARQRGIGTGASFISPHGDARDRREVIEQVMRKIDGNIKHGQYKNAPTFLVVSTDRASLHDRAEELKKQVVAFDGTKAITSGHLWAIAAHQYGHDFFFEVERGVASCSIDRNGILLDHDYIAGIIFLRKEWSEQDWKEAYRLNGIYNLLWEEKSEFDDALKLRARQTFNKLCHASNDTLNNSYKEHS